MIDQTGRFLVLWILLHSTGCCYSTVFALYSLLFMIPDFTPYPMLSRLHPSSRLLHHKLWCLDPCSWLLIVDSLFIFTFTPFALTRRGSADVSVLCASNAEAISMDLAYSVVFTSSSSFVSWQKHFQLESVNARANLGLNTATTCFPVLPPHTLATPFPRTGQLCLHQSMLCAVVDNGECKCRATGICREAMTE